MTRSGSALSPMAQGFRTGRPTDLIDRLPIGQSERPGSRWHTTMELWEQGHLHPAPLPREAVMRCTEQSTVLAQ